MRRRRILLIIVVVLVFSFGVIVPVLALTPLGAPLFSALTHGAPTVIPAPTPIPATPSPSPTPEPILTVRGTPPAITSGAAILLDATTGHILDDVNGETPMPMASTTKIMTAIIAIQTADLNQVVTIQRDAYEEVYLHDGSSADLVVGDKIALKDLLYGLMLPSGDDAAIAIADALGGTSANFVNTMNLFALRLHLFQTHYINPDGLTYYGPNGAPLPDHYTTAYDLVRLAQYAMANPLFAQIVQTQRYVLPANGQHHAYIWTTTNELLSTYSGATGIKTGHTIEAAYCLVFAARRGNEYLIGVVLHNADSELRFKDAKTLLDWGFSLPLLPPM